MSHKRDARRLRRTFEVAYQIAGELLLAPELLTEGQRGRLRELLLNILSEPDRYEALVAQDLYLMAKEP